MKVMQQEAMVILYRNNNSPRKIKESLNEFCISNNISIIDIITVTGKYEYLTLKRIFQIIKYSPKSMALVTDTSLQKLIPVIIIFTILEVINSNVAIDLILNFLNEYTEKFNEFITGEKSTLANCTESLNLENFMIIPSYEIEKISDEISRIKYKIAKNIR